MAYQTGDNILDNHYNDFATSVNAIWGTGSGDSGYGQTNTVSSVSTSDTVQASQWTTLLARITSLASHQGSSITTITNPSAGDQIEAFSALSTNIATCTTNRLNVSSRATIAESNCSTTTTLGTSHITQTGNWTWGSTENARFFFNAGGRISVRWDLSSFTADSKANQWNTLASNCGTYFVNAQSSGKSGGGGTAATNQTNFGWHDLTTSFQVAFKQNVASSYTANYIQLSLRRDDPAVEFISLWQDDASDQTSFNKSIYNVQDLTDGTKQTFFGHEEPETTHIADTWGDGPTQNVTGNG
tara:strand:+ start:370 stop:1269 length:900 start_codon:yes stop_codon:yes gene_type:complete